MVFPGILALIMAAVLPACGTEVKVSSAAGKPIGAGAVKKFVAMVLEEGAAESLPPALRAAYELPDGLDGRVLQVFPEDAADGLLHAFNALVEDSDPAVVRRLILLTRKQPPDGRKTEFHAFICTPDGALLKVVRSAWSYDAEGQVVGKSGAHKLLDISAPATRERFRRELNFWIRGRYRKK